MVSAADSRFRWDSMTPLGRPVVPEVYTISGERVGRDMRFGFRTGIRSRREPSAGIAHALALLAQGLPATQTQHPLEIGQVGAVRGKTQPPVITVDEQQARAGVGKDMSGGRGSVGREQGHDDQAKRQGGLVEAHPFDAVVEQDGHTVAGGKPFLLKSSPPAPDKCGHIVPREAEPGALSGIVLLVSDIGAAMHRTALEEIRHGSRTLGAPPAVRPTSRLG